MIINLPSHIQSRTKENESVNEAKKATKYEVEKEYK